LQDSTLTPGLKRLRYGEIMILLQRLIATAAILQEVAVGFDGGPQKPIPSDYVCKHPPYKIHKVSVSPLIIYIEDFLAIREREHLKAIRLVGPAPSQGQ
jgi:hypothetical protein